VIQIDSGCRHDPLQLDTYYRYAVCRQLPACRAGAADVTGDCDENCIHCLFCLYRQLKAEAAV